jgi:hypothetical protein
MYGKLCVLALAAGLSVAAQKEVEAKVYGSFVLRNPSSVTIHYQIKWGDGEWKSCSLPPNHIEWHAFPLDEDGYTPRPKIRFDWIGGDGSVTNRYYDLQTRATSTPRYGKRYVFRYSGAGRFLDLHSE